MSDVLFVHGTGVRGNEYKETMATLAQQRGLDGWRLHGCLWGDDLGAQLGQARSVPLYAQSKALESDTDALQDWTCLLQDPFIEIRIVGSAPSAEHNPFEAAAPEPKAVTRLSAVASRLREPALVLIFGAEPAITTVSGKSLEALAESAAELRDLPGLRDALLRAAALAQGRSEGDDIAAELAARAIVAGWLLRGDANGLAAPDGAGRDAVVSWLSVELGASTEQSKSLLSNATAALLWPLRKLGGTAGTLALRAGKWGAARYRKSLTDASSLRIGDILLYQARGAPIRARIAESIRAIGRPVVLMAHSLGGIAAVDLLVESAGLPVRGLITVGSQAPFLYEIGALASMEPGTALPGTFPPWLNVFDRNDLLSFMAKPIFNSPTVRDEEVVSGQPFPIAHSAYWVQIKFWKAFSTFTDGLPG
jgi:hypothetical protein